MNNQEYIASGILEKYAAGGLTPAERQEVAQRAAASPEVRTALDDAFAAHNASAPTYADQPKPGSESKALKVTATDEQDSAQDAALILAEEEAKTDGMPRYSVDEDQEPSPYKWMITAGIVLFLLSGMFGYTFYTKWKEAEGRMEQLAASEQQLAQNQTAAARKLSQQEQLLAILRDPGFKEVELQGVRAHPKANVFVYWNPDKQRVFLEVLNLPAPPAGRQYQLWALDNGKPVDAGLLTMAASPVVQQMKAVGYAQSFVVTLEPEGGSLSPAMSALYVKGDVKS